MKRTTRSTARLVLALALLAASRAAATAPTEPIEPTEPTEPIDLAEVTHGPLTIALPGAWFRVAADSGDATTFESARGARVAIASCESSVAVSPLHARGVRRELERCLRGSALFDETDLRAVMIVDVDGVPAYRVRLAARAGSREEEKLVYVVGGESAVVVAFSAAPEEFEPGALSFDRALRRARLAEKPVMGLSRAASSGILVLSSLLGYAARLALRRARRVPQGSTRARSSSKRSGE